MLGAQWVGLAILRDLSSKYVFQVNLIFTLFEPHGMIYNQKIGPFWPGSGAFKPRISLSDFFGSLRAGIFEIFSDYQIQVVD